MAPSADPEQGAGGAAEVLARIEGVAAAQSRMEGLLLAVQRDLGALAAGLGEAGWAQCGGCPPAEAAASPREEAAPKAAEAGPKAEEAAAEEEGAAARARAPRASGRGGEESSEDEDDEVPASLPEGWPHSLAVRWLPEAHAHHHHGSGGSRTLHRVGTLKRQETSEVSKTLSGLAVLDDGGEDGAPGSTRCVAIDPNSNAYALWSVASAVLLLHDLLLIPYMIAWDVDLKGALLVISLASCCFWTLDVGMCFTTGYSVHGRLERRLPFVARRYARTWLLPDIAIAGCDWVGILLALAASQSITGLRILRFAKLWKLVRLVGLVRTIKVFRRAEDIVQGRLSDAGRACLRALLMVCGTFLFNHVFGCAWYCIGRVAPSDTGMRWVDKDMDWNGDSVPFLASGHLHQYITSFHWSMAQFTLGAMDFVSYNSIERTFNIVCLAMGLIFGSCLVSILSASMVDQQMAKNAQNETLRKLRHFLREHRISRGVAALAQQQVQERLAIPPRLQEEDVTALQLLSRDLRTTLRHETFQEQLHSHGLFRLWEDMSVGTARQVCMEVMESGLLRGQDDLFVPGASAGKAHCLASGHVTYIQQPETAPVAQERRRTVEAGAWLSEAALWSHWVHVGTARARDHCQVVSLCTEHLMDVLARHPVISQISREYGRNFHWRIVGARPPLAHWPDDLEVPYTDYGELVASMSPHLRARICACAAEQAPGRRQLSSEGLARLQEEVAAGGCTVTVGAQGQLQRVVSEAPVVMRNPQGRLLAELGRAAAEAGSRRARATCRLPAARQQADEEPRAVYLRLLERLGLQQDDVHVLDVARELAWRESGAHGLRTKRLRTVHRVSLRGELPLPALVPRSARASARPVRASARADPPESRASQRRSTTSSGSSTSDAEVLPRRQRMSMASGMPRVPRTSLFSGPSDAEPSLPPEMQHASVYRIKDDDGALTFYAWLDEETFQHYTSPAGENELDAVVALLCRQSLENEFTI